MQRVRASDDGLLTSRGGVVPWEQVWHLEWTRDGADIATGAGLLCFDRTTAEAVERRLAPWEAARDRAIDDLPPEERAAWAELRPGERLSLRQAPTMRVLTGFMWLLAVGLGLGMASLGMVAGTILGTSFFALFAGLALLVQRTGVGPRYLVDADGIETVERRPRRYRWSDLRTAEELTGAGTGSSSATQFIVSTRQGRLVLRSDYAEGPRLREAIRRCLARRRELGPAEQERGQYASLAWGHQALWLDDTGLAVLRPGVAERVTWDQLAKPEWLSEGPRLRVAGRSLRLWRYVGGAGLARSVDCQQGGNEPLVDTRGELRAAVIERWLGVGPGGAMTCGLSPWATVGCGALLVAAFGLMCLAAAEGGRLHGNVGGMVVFVMMLAGMVKSARSIRADASGLSVQRKGRREYYAWSAVQGIAQSQYVWTIDTDRGPLAISTQAANVGRVVGVIRRILAERDLGSTLPSTAPLPETALSRMRGDAAATDDRGLSLTSGGET